MSSSRILSPYLDRIIKNSSWRKHSTIVSSCKSTLDLLNSLPESLPEFLPDAALHPLILTLESSSPKLSIPALDAIHRLFSLSLIDPASPSLDRLLSSLCSSGAIADESLEIGMLRAIVAAVRFAPVLIRGDWIVQIVKSCYNVCLGSRSDFNRVCGKIALVQILRIVFARVEVDCLDVEIEIVAVADLVDDLDLVMAGGEFIREAMGGEEREERCEVGGGGEMSWIREDGFVLFKNLCKFSMKFAGPGENVEDPLLLRGKVLSLELLKIVMENAGDFWLVNER